MTAQARRFYERAGYFTDADGSLLQGAVTVNDALRELFFESGTVVEFLKAGNTEEFLFIDSRSSGW